MIFDPGYAVEQPSPLFLRPVREENNIPHVPDVGLRVNAANRVDCLWSCGHEGTAGHLGPLHSERGCKHQILFNNQNAYNDDGSTRIEPMRAWASGVSAVTSNGAIGMLLLAFGSACIVWPSG